MRRIALSRSLSAKILLLTVACVLLGEVLIYVPSIARFRLAYLEERIGAAHLAVLSLTPRVALQLDMDAVDALLAGAGVLEITVDSATNRPLMLGEIAPVDRIVDLQDRSWTTLIEDAFQTLAHRGARLIRVIGPAPQEAGTVVDVIMSEAAMWTAMVDYSVRIVTLSVVLSLLVAAMLFVALQRMIVRPLRRITGELAAFRDRPEDSTADQPRPARAGRNSRTQGASHRSQTAAACPRAPATPRAGTRPSPPRGCNSLPAARARRRHRRRAGGRGAGRLAGRRPPPPGVGG